MVWYEGKIIKIKQETPQTRRFWLKIERETPFEFRAGQFITMDLPISERRTKRWRSYSIASAPEGSNILEFCIVRLEQGAGTTYLFEEANIGTMIKFKGPDGGFYLPETIEKDLVFICTGTGIAPFRSMLLDLAQASRGHQHLHLIFGTRTADGILYQQEMQKLQEINPKFKLDIALSREKTADTHNGYVHPIYQKAYEIVRPNVVFYLCGWSNMIDEAVANLMNMGYDKSQIKFELYG
jgi:ferredoxin-NADP reductase